ncbi:hypothetical protein [Streptomyces sp. NPDC017940]|uniref:hypothetical protein n=1 Tax=Streptomyces sp. NPDC017940 TaxID=3365017 RepID=UPI00379DEBD1
MRQVIYAERSRNPFAQVVELSTAGLRNRGRTTPLSELHLPAMADAFVRGGWLGGGGTERGLAELPEGPGVVPVTRVTGTTRPVKVRRAAEFAHRLGELAVRQCGGPEQVAALAARAAAEGVPLWQARRFAPGPAGPVTVAVERRLFRVDVWGPAAPVVRIRAPYGLFAADRSPSRGLVLTVGEVTATLTLTKVWRKSRSSVTVHSAQGRWELRRTSTLSSELLRDGYRVALLTRPRHRRRPQDGSVLLPLAQVHHDSPDPLDAVMAHTCAVAFGLGDTTGTCRFRPLPPRRDGHSGEPVVIEWDNPWFTNLGWGSDDNESGGGDGWGSDGGEGGDGGGGGGGDGGGGDGGGGGGD